jgi:hypothetical protein
MSDRKLGLAERTAISAFVERELQDSPAARSEVTMLAFRLGVSAAFTAFAIAGVKPRPDLPPTWFDTPEAMPDGV